MKKNRIENKHGGSSTWKAEIDWRSHYSMTEVLTQSQDTCWAFATVDMVEMEYKRRFNARVRLSMQEVLDFSGRRKNPVQAMDYIRDHGLVKDEHYRFVGTKQENAVRPEYPRLKIENYGALEDTSTLLNEIGKHLAEHPLIIQAEVGEDMWELRGVRGWEIHYLNHEIIHNHALIVVGQGIDKNVPYLIVKNSWGTSWGVNGFGRISRDLSVVKKAFYPMLQAQRFPVMEE